MWQQSTIFPPKKTFALVMSFFFFVTKMQKFIKNKSIAPIVGGGLNQFKLLEDNTISDQTTKIF
jgi:hypothetical protein